MLSDLDDAIHHVLKNACVDPGEVHIVGSSGGGYATLLAYMNVKYPVNSFSAWVPISNLVDWYRESVGRKQKYAQDILMCTGSGETLDVEEAKKRSPYFQTFPREARRNAKLFLYAGIHDGYQGSVPITQSIDMYNRLLQEMMPGRTGDLVSDADRLELVVKRCFLPGSDHRTIGARKLHYQKQSATLSLSIFEGGHEQIVEEVIPLIPIARKYRLTACRLPRAR